MTVSKALGAIGSTFYGIFSQSAKHVIGAHMKNAVPGPGYMHTPASRDRRWFDQITSEQKLRVVSNGQVGYYWKVKSVGIRNEALDCRVYALAALRGLYAKGALSPLDRIGAAVPGKSPPAPAPVASSANSKSPDAHAVTPVTAPKPRPPTPRRVASRSPYAKFAVTCLRYKSQIPKKSFTFLIKDLQYKPRVIFV